MKRHPLVLFWLLALAISWGLWLPLAAAAHGWLELPFTAAQAHLYGAYGPALAALAATAWAGGISGLRQLFGRLLRWRVWPLWYLVALLLPAGVSLLTTALHTMWGGDAPDFSQPPVRQLSLSGWLSGWNSWALLLPLFLQQLFLGSAVGEELAWRGFVLERLQQRRTAWKASLSIGLAWSLWAMPLVCLPWPVETWVWRALVLVAGAVPAAVLATWLYNCTGGSLLLVVLFNTATKLTDLFVTPSVTHPLLPVLAFWILAGWVLWSHGPKDLGRLVTAEPRPQPEEAGAPASASP